MSQPQIKEESVQQAEPERSQQPTQQKEQKIVNKKEQPKEEAQNHQDDKEIEIKEIIQEKIGKQRTAEQSKASSKVVEPPVIVNPIHFYKSHEKFNWRVDELQISSCLDKLQFKMAPEIEQFTVPQGIQITYLGTITDKKDHVNYNVKIKDHKGQREIARRYTEYMNFRHKITQLWPCFLICSLPNKTIMGVSDEQLYYSRSKFVIRFLKSLACHQEIYQSDQVQLFLSNTEQNIQEYLDNLPIPKSLQIFSKYKKTYEQLYFLSTSQEFLYRKGDIPKLAEQYQNYFSNKKKDLMDSLMAMRRLADSKQKYFKAIRNLNQTLLPDYQDMLYRWIYGESLPKAPQSILQRMSRKSQPSQESGTKASEADMKFGLFSNEAYKAKLDDTAMLMTNFNNSTWQLYYVIKYELKEIDTVLVAIEQLKSSKRQLEYYIRTIAINKEQIQALNQNKTTLKTFLMEGKPDDKKTRLANDNNLLEEQMEKLEEFYILLLAILEKQFKDYHHGRAQFYEKTMKKALSEQLSVTRGIMEFHAFEEQLFSKDRAQRLQLLQGQDKTAEKEETQEIQS